ncbi:hypothetical protein CPB86DRAFT_780376 [Serendipita vermifera]|nr:hypothetical protein CPB86DRAFT_780376 [Serendipita vermifera]
MSSAPPYNPDLDAEGDELSDDELATSSNGDPANVPFQPSAGLGPHPSQQAVSPQAYYANYPPQAASPSLGRAQNFLQQYALFPKHTVQGPDPVQQAAGPHSPLANANSVSSYHTQAPSQPYPPSVPVNYSHNSTPVIRPRPPHYEPPLPNQSPASSASSEPAGKKHLCVRCAAGFDRRYDLKRHMHTHSDVKEFKCPRCQKELARNDSLQRHQSICKGPKLSAT